MKAAAELDGKKNAEAGKYLTFKLDSEEYGLKIQKVKEIIGVMSITKVPKTPDYVRGVINLRGMVIPVVDLREKFGLAAVIDTKETCIIVVEIMKAAGIVSTGLLVDSVSEVADIGEKDIEAAPVFGGDTNTSYILGMAKLRGGIKILLDIENVLSTEEIVEIEKLK